MKKIILISFAITFGLFFQRCNADFTKQTTHIEYDDIEQDDQVENKKLEKLISPYDKALTAEMNVVIGNLKVGMSKGRPESLLSNFMADLVFEEISELENFKADFCLLNLGGIRAPLPSGDIKVKHIYELMPFENEVVIVEVKGEKIQEIADYLNYTGGEPVSNIQLKLGSEPKLTISGREITTDETYHIVTSDYLAKGGDKMYFFNDPVSLTKSGIKIRDMILDYFIKKTKNGEPINSELDGRIQ